MLKTIEVATQEFASKGLSRARSQELTAFTRTSKRMIYHHFGSKKGLCVHVLEAVLKRIRLVMNENMHKGVFLTQSKTIQHLNLPAINAINAGYRRGVKAGGSAVLLMPWTCTCRSALCAFSTARTNTRFHSFSNTHLTLPTPLPAVAPMLSR